ncbi:hypothetical protein P7H12_24925 [Paenibacillus larvae]|nr:hypothetical protein [Paenibacillus larvae]MDT2266184.1 hypothetical protein [Paenibacillus larvae]
MEIPKLHFTLDDLRLYCGHRNSKRNEGRWRYRYLRTKQLKVFAAFLTVINGSDANWSCTSRQHYNPVLPQKEKKVAFTTNPKTGEEHMSFYKSELKKSWQKICLMPLPMRIADLHEDYRESVKIAALPDYKNINIKSEEW